MPLTAAYDWVDVIVGFDDFMDAARYGNALACQDGILTKLITPIAAPDPLCSISSGTRNSSGDEPEHRASCMVAPHALDAFVAFTRAAEGEIVFRRRRRRPIARACRPPIELTWNHTTLRALRVDPSITYLQSLYPVPEPARAGRRR